MSLTKKQKRFAYEFSVDHNATQAAIRAGYAEGTARQQGYRLVKMVAVKQLISRLDLEKRADLSVSGQQELERLEYMYEHSAQLQPRIWKGKPVTWTDEADKTHMVMEMRSPVTAVKALELKLRLEGLLERRRSSVEVTETIVYTLALDRDLSEGVEE